METATFPTCGHLGRRCRPLFKIPLWKHGVPMVFVFPAIPLGRPGPELIC